MRDWRNTVSLWLFVVLPVILAVGTVLSVATTLKVIKWVME